MACTWPMWQQAAWAANWDDLFAISLLGVRRIAPTLAPLKLRPDPIVTAWAADLAVRETPCCSFFTFSQTATSEVLTEKIANSPEQVAGLDAAADRAVGVTAGVVR